MITIYLKTAWRSLRKNKGHNFLNIIGLAIGIACTGLIFLWTEDELTFDQSNLKKNRLYELNINMPYGGNFFTMISTPRPLAAALKTEIAGVANAARYSDEEQRSLLTINDKALYIGGRYADPSLFSMFTFHFIEGNSRNPFPQLYSIVITKSTARKFFGQAANVIGKTIRFDNKQDYVISGVVSDIPTNSTLQFGWLAPYEVITAQNPDDANAWDSFGPITYVELNENARIDAVNKQLKDLIPRKSVTGKREAFLFPMSDWRLYHEFANGKPTGSGRIKQLRMLTLIAWIILLIACINFMNLATARSEQRAKEVGVRKALGSGKKRLVAQFMAEALLLSIIATLIAVLIIYVSLPAFNAIMQKQLVLNLVAPLHIIFLIAISLICGLVAGSYPALYLSSFNPVTVLKGIKMKTSGASVVRKGLVITQFVVSIVFIIATIVVYLQLQNIQTRNLGFNKNNLIEINPQIDISKSFPMIKADLLRTGLFENAAITNHATLYGGDTDDRFRWQGKAEDQQISIAHRNVSSEFISTSGMRILEGRDFNNSPSENLSVVINESLAKLVDEHSAVGKIIQSPRGNPDGIFSNMTVIGVVSDYVYGNIYGKADPLIMFCKPLQDQSLIYARIKPEARVQEAMAKLEDVMKKNNPIYPLEYKFVDDQFHQMYQNETVVGKVSTVFAALAIVISCLGLFGLAAYTAERRIKEIGIRKVLGSSVSEIAILLSKDFVKLVIVACLVAFPTAWWIMNDWLQSYEYRVTMSWWIFMAAGVFAILIALSTISFQSIKAGMANPIKSLRSE